MSKHAMTSAAGYTWKSSPSPSCLSACFISWGSRRGPQGDAKFKILFQKFQRTATVLVHGHACLFHFSYSHRKPCFNWFMVLRIETLHPSHHWREVYQHYLNSKWWHVKRDIIWSLLEICLMEGRTASSFPLFFCWGRANGRTWVESLLAHEMVLWREAQYITEKQDGTLGVLNKGVPALRHFSLDTNMNKK